MEPIPTILPQGSWFSLLLRRISSTDGYYRPSSVNYTFYYCFLNLCGRTLAHHAGYTNRITSCTSVQQVDYNYESIDLVRCFYPCGYAFDVTHLFGQELVSEFKIFENRRFYVMGVRVIHFNRVWKLGLRLVSTCCITENCHWIICYVL